MSLPRPLSEKKPAGGATPRLLGLTVGWLRDRSKPARTARVGW